MLLQTRSTCILNQYKAYLPRSLIQALSSLQLLYTGCFWPIMFHSCGCGKTNIHTYKHTHFSENNFRKPGMHPQLTVHQEHNESSVYSLLWEDGLGNPLQWYLSDAMRRPCELYGLSLHDTSDIEHTGFNLLWYHTHVWLSKCIWTIKRDGCSLSVIIFGSFKEVFNSLSYSRFPCIVVRQK